MRSTNAVGDTPTRVEPADRRATAIAPTNATTATHNVRQAADIGIDEQATELHCVSAIVMPALGMATASPFILSIGARVGNAMRPTRATTTIAKRRIHLRS